MNLLILFGSNEGRVEMISNWKVPDGMSCLHFCYQALRHLTQWVRCGGWILIIFCVADTIDQLSEGQLLGEKHIRRTN